MVKEYLTKFESDIANLFNEKKIRAPIHLYDGNEDHVLRVFQKVKKDDWVCCTWRSHYQCLLKGVPSHVLKEKILKGKSISLCFEDYRVVSSAIVGGILPIATGIAWGEKLKNTKNHVWCFMGDMSSATGIWDECRRYSLANDLPITWIIEDNGKSVLTPTDVVWGNKYPAADYKKRCNSSGYYEEENVIYYQYDSKYPHAGAGRRITF